MLWELAVCYVRLTVLGVDYGSVKGRVRQLGTDHIGISLQPSVDNRPPCSSLPAGTSAPLVEAFLLLPVPVA